MLSHTQRQQMTYRGKNWKSLESNYFPITGWHYQVTVSCTCGGNVPTMTLFSYTFPLLICLLFVQPFVPSAPQMWRLWDIVDQCLMADKLTQKTVWHYSHILYITHSVFSIHSFSSAYLCCGGSKLSKETQMSFSPATSPSPRRSLGVPRLGWDMYSLHYCGGIACGSAPRSLPFCWICLE